MKLLLLSITILMCGATASATEFATYTKIIQLDNQKKSDIYPKARQWFSEHFVSGKSVIDYENSEKGTIIGTGYTVTDVVFTTKQNIKFSIKVDTKDNKVRIQMKTLQYFDENSSSTYEVTYISDARLSEAKAALEATARSLKTYLKNNREDDSW